MLIFEEQGDALIAHATKPLRVRNEALGYELRFHLPEYKTSPDLRTRYGPVEFDTLEAQSPEQRKAWAEARRETYTGSYDHFIDALVADALKEEGFQYWITQDTKWGVGERTPNPESDMMTDARHILEPASLPGHFILAVPDRDYNLLVRYVREGERHAYTRRYRSHRSSRNNQISLLLLLGGNRFLIDKKNGATFNGQIVQRGYWGWYETAATVLPYNYRPPETQ